MRSGLLVGGTVWLLSTASPASGNVEIPEHPRDLQFPDSPVQLPTAEGRRGVLSNGTVVYLAPDRTLPLVEITLALRAGSFLDPVDMAGLAYLTGAQIRRGGTDMLDADGFDDAVDSLGGRIDTVAGTTRSGASLSVPSWSLDEGLDLFFAMLERPAFQPDRLAAARSNLLESMSRRNENALEVLEREWQGLMYGEEHFSTRPLTPQSLGAIDRRDLVTFHENFWRPDRMILAVSGDFDRATLLAALEHRFASWRSNAEPTPKVSWPPPAPMGRAASGLYHYEKDIPQAKVMVGHRLAELLDWRSPERFVIEVLAELLAGRGAISRIGGRLRTAEGLVYRVSASLDAGTLWAGELRIFFDTGNSSVARAVELVIEELERLRSEPVHVKELEVVKQSLLARLQLQFDTAEEVAGFLAEDELLDRPHEYWQGYLDGIALVSADDVQRAATTYLRPAELSCLVVGRWREISAGAPAGESTLERLARSPVTVLVARDPLTLEVTQNEKKGAQSDADRRHGGLPR